MVVDLYYFDQNSNSLEPFNTARPRVIFTPPSGTVTFYIQVRDTSGNGLAGATVTAVGIDNTYQATTSTLGWADLTVLEGSYDITAAKSGFVAQTMLGVVRDVNNSNNLTFDLTADSEPVAPGQPSVLTQPSQPYGSSWLPNDITYPTVSYVNSVAKIPGLSIWGIYLWINEYKGLRSQINNVGWKTVRVGGPNFDDTLMTMLVNDDITVIRNIHDSPRRENYGSNQAYIDAVKQRASGFLNRYGPGGSFWSDNPSLPYRPVTTMKILNEPNFHYMWTNGTYEQRAQLYSQLLPQVHDHIHQWPGMTTVGYNAGDASRAGNAWFRDVSAALASAGNINKFDAAAHQPYTSSVAPDLKFNQFSGWSHGRNVNDYRQHIQNNGRSVQQVPWLWTEGGWILDPSAGGSFARAGMTDIILWASHYVRMYLIGMRMGLTSVTPMFITDSDNYNGGFFPSIGNPTWRPNAIAVQSMINLMPNPVLHSAIRDGPDDFLHRYHRDGAGSPLVACVWRATGAGTMSVPVESSSVIVTDMLGNKGSVTASGSTVSLNVGPLPIFVES